MQKNANVGSKLLALIAVPAVVLVAVASLAAGQRLDDADQAQQTEDGARLAATSTALAHELQAERLLSMRLAYGDEEVAAQLNEQRVETDAAAEEVASPQPVVGDRSVARRYEAAVGQIQTVAELRASIDDGNAAPEVALDAYTTAVDSLLELDAALASGSGVPELNATLTDNLTLARAKEARALRAARIAGMATVGAYRAGDYPALADLEAEEERQFARLEESQNGELTTEMRNTMASPEVREADALLAAVMDEGVLGGSGDPGVEPQTWQDSATQWLEAVRRTESGALDTTIARADTAAFEADKSARLFLIGTAAAVILSILLASLLARRISRRLQRLTGAADQLATVELPRLVEDLQSPGDADAPPEPITPIEVDSGDEIGRLAEAFNAIQKVTSQVAEEQAALLRRGIADIFVNLARRNQSLLDRQIEFIDGLEAQEQDPDQLENLFKLDHLATRMRRNAESLLVLAGAEPPRRRARPVDLADVVRVAIGEVEDFTRINLLALDETTVGGNAAVDLAHLLSELMENATQFSPPDSTVEVSGQMTPEGGYTVTIADHGIGMSAEQLAEANVLLSSPPPVGLALSRSLGFIVVGRLARRLEVGVGLTPSPAGGVTAVVDLPTAVLSGRSELDQERGPVAGAAGPTAPFPVEDPRPLVTDDPSRPTAGAAVAAGPASLSDALPDGEDFERGLASLVGPDTPGAGAPPAPDEIDQSFWGEPADVPQDDTFADLAGPADLDEPSGFPAPDPLDAVSDAQPPPPRHRRRPRRHRSPSAPRRPPMDQPRAGSPPRTGSTASWTRWNRHRPRRRPRPPRRRPRPPQAERPSPAVSRAPP